MITTKGRYALCVLLDLAEHPENEYTPLRDIALRQDISKKYLEIIVKDLVKGGFLTGTSGRGGGYRLCRRPEEYPVGEILEAMEGTLATVACLADGAKPCSQARICKILPMWAEFDSMVHDYFYGKTLADLL